MIDVVRSVSLLVIAWVGMLVAAESATAPLQVAVKPAPPFVMQDAGGVWSGFSVDLWQAVARDIGRPVVWQETSLEGLLDAVAAGEVAAGVGAITATLEREKRVDFSHPFISTGLGIAVGPEAGNPLMNLLKAVFSWRFVQAIGALAVLLGLVGVAIWLVERRRNAEQFGGGTVQGIGSGFWWSAVTMTTVGYGDKAPATLLGRLVGLAWMFASIIIISGFTAGIASSLTVGYLGSDIKGLGDLQDARIGVVEGTSGASFVGEQGFASREYDDAAAALAGLVAGEVEAVIHDQPLLNWRLRQPDWQHTDVKLLGQEVHRQDYAFALPVDSPLREQVNQALLRLVESGELAGIRARYLDP